MYLSLVLGSLINDIKKKVNTTKTRKNRWCVTRG
jgi:hypothetical protein